jgi:hypothetical protein
VWYMVMNVLEVHAGAILTGHQKVRAVCPDQNLSTHQLRLYSPIVRNTIILNLNILHFYALYH